jgi:peptidoglycan/xylan/chitin deacetylase (PgdA/CDA1 family)
MLPTLKRRGVKVTFFVSGRWADKNPALLRQMAADGHEIATHGYDLQYGPSDLERAGKLRDDIARSVLAIERITVQKVKYYAPHKSEVSTGIVKAAAALDLRTVLYSLDTVDWDPQTSGDLILKRISKASAGDLILLHPKPNTARVLAQALIELEAKGLHPVTLSELLNPRVDGSSVGTKGQHE